MEVQMRLMDIVGIVLIVEGMHGLLLEPFMGMILRIRIDIPTSNGIVFWSALMLVVGMLLVLSSPNKNKAGCTSKPGS